jgi:hypothetical protein
MKTFLRFFLLVLLCLQFVKKSEAQTTTQISTTTARANAFSPSITSFVNGSAENLVSAYVYPLTSTRTVAISVSANGGSSWIDKSLTAPHWDPTDNTTELLENMDDPQVISVGGQNVVCVVRHGVRILRIYKAKHIKNSLVQYLLNRESTSHFLRMAEIHGDIGLTD